MYYRSLLDFVKSIEILNLIEKSTSSDKDMLNLYYKYSSIYSQIDDHEMEEYYLKKISNASSWWLDVHTAKFDAAISNIKRDYPLNNQTKIRCSVNLITLREILKQHLIIMISGMIYLKK
jgi:hypothetical protein